MCEPSYSDGLRISLFVLFVKVYASDHIMDLGSNNQKTVGDVNMDKGESLLDRTKVQSLISSCLLAYLRRK